MDTKDIDTKDMNTKDMNTKEDLVNIYSFGIFLNLHLFTYKYILFSFGFFESIFYFILFNFLISYGFNYSMYELLFNKLWTSNFNNACMPLLLNSVGNIIVLNVNINKYELFINKTIFDMIFLFLLNYYLSYYYPNELTCCKMFRFNSAIFYFFLWNLC